MSAEKLEFYPLREIPKDVLPFGPATIYRMIQRGDLESFKIGAKRFVSQEAITKLVERQIKRAREEASSQK